ncbi:cysteine-rich CWC family protein [Ignavibacterium sp.]|jgi:hypothetical protein|uniref:cysteine-rich CWC family protein n=1 Tax=Ignavibacterium sp. TaxID=2651167 RepID=UPI0025C6719B|nr:cysteine-rich CWC family protein [Ignavibacterium sp.]
MISNKYELKRCPKCDKEFQCKAGNITQCQCFTIELNSAELRFIKEIYDDCLCAECMIKMKQLFKEKQVLNYYSGIKKDDFL